jgi:two-component system phosphate regulon response regulator PhoB/two-component system alkaline phosphatase synthesis response regulator PhoP
VKLVAVVDDEPDIVELVILHLRKAGFKVEGFLSAEKFLKFVDKTKPDLVILDLMLPDTDGLEVCKYLKGKEELAAIPVIILTARDEESDKVLGLELGADDYVTKPFSPKELAARVKAVLRRQVHEEKAKIITVGENLTLDSEKYEVWADDKRISLTSTEFKILKLLASRKGRVFTRDEILDSLWGHEKIVLDRTVDVHIRNLREKLGKAARFIQNVRGIGYKLEE